MCHIDKKILPPINNLQPDSLLKFGLPDIIKIHYQIVFPSIFNFSYRKLSICHKGDSLLILPLVTPYFSASNFLLEIVQLTVSFLHMMSCMTFLVRGFGLNF